MEIGNIYVYVVVKLSMYNGEYYSSVDIIMDEDTALKTKQQWEESSGTYDGKYLRTRYVQVHKRKLMLCTIN